MKHVPNGRLFAYLIPDVGVCRLFVELWDQGTREVDIEFIHACSDFYQDFACYWGHVPENYGMQGPRAQRLVWPPFLQYYGRTGIGVFRAIPYSTNTPMKTIEHEAQTGESLHHLVLGVAVKLLRYQLYRVAFSRGYVATHYPRNRRAVFDGSRV